MAPIKERKSAVILLFDFFMIAYTICLNIYYGISEMPCWLGYINAWVLLPGCVFTYLLRCWILYFRYQLTNERLECSGSFRNERLLSVVVGLKNGVNETLSRHVNHLSTSMTRNSSSGSIQLASASEFKSGGQGRTSAVGNKNKKTLAPHTRNKSVSIGQKDEKSESSRRTNSNITGLATIGEPSAFTPAQTGDDSKPVENSTLWYNSHRHMSRSAYLLKRFVVLELFICIAMFIVVVTNDKLDAVRSELTHCVSDVVGLNEAYIGFLLLVTMVIIWFAVALRNCNDGFNVKTELFICAMCALVGAVFYALFGTEYPYQPLDGNTVAFVLFVISTGYPVFRTYVQPPITQPPKEVESVEKLIAFPEGFASFKSHLVCEFSVENILFWQAVEQYRDFCAEVEAKKLGPVPRYRRSRQIFRKYVKIGSNLEINVSSNVSAAVKKVLDCDEKSVDMSKVTPYIFDHAQQEILGLMQTDSFPRYLASGKWKHLRKN